MPTARGRFRSQTNTFPTTFACPFRWAVQIDGQTDVGTADVNAFSLNSLFDPNITGAGTQPKFYDTLLGAAGGTAPYDTYIVVRTHVRVSLQNSSTSSMFAYIQVYSDTAGISPTCPMYEYLEVPNLLKVPLPSASQTGGNRVVEFDVDIAKFLGAEDILDNDNCRAQWDSNPGRQVYMDVGFRSTTDAGTTTFSYTVEIVYEAVLCGLNDTSAFMAASSVIAPGPVLPSSASSHLPRPKLSSHAASPPTGEGNQHARAVRH
jgi:hypothetical protein